MAEPGTVTIALVHGAFAESYSNWKPVLELLLAKGYKVVATPNPLRGVSSDAAHVSSMLNTIDGPIVLVGHSYGGAVITNAANGNQSVKALVYVAAWKAIPSWFIFGTRDNSIPVSLLAFMAERAGSKKTVTIEGASHAVMMSHADAVVELVEQAAAAVGGDGATAPP